METDSVIFEFDLLLLWVVSKQNKHRIKNYDERAQLFG